MRGLTCLLCCCALLLGSACAVRPDTLQPGSPALQGGVQDAKSVPPMTLRAGTSPLTGLPLREGQSVVARPVSVMLDNVRVALPQRGIAQAAIVYELVAESGITRLLAVYENTAGLAALPEIGPVRSARDVQVQLAIGQDALLLHVGGSTYATDLLELYHYADRSINSFYQVGALELDADRNATVAVEHCWFTSGALLAEAAQVYALSTQQDNPQPAFQFAAHHTALDATAPRALGQSGAQRATIRFSSYDTTVLTYRPVSAPLPTQDKAAAASLTQNAEPASPSAQSTQPRTRASDTTLTGVGVYEKAQFGAPQIDENTGETLSFTNVLVLFADIGEYADGVLAQVDMMGGMGYYLCGGRYERVRWEKGLPEQPLRILTQDGTQYVQINPGTTYVAVVGLDKEKYFTLQAIPETDLAGAAQEAQP